MSNSLSVQIVIAGGGIAGLWLLNRLSSEGYDVVLLEKNALGNAQTLASQGIIHGGLKYALGGVLSPASSAIADMPARWRACLAGDDVVDLRGTRVLSEHYYMWSSGSVRSRLKTFLGSKALRGRIDALSAEQYPTFFSEAEAQNTNAVKGTLYQLTDFVIDTPSLLHTLAAPWQDRIFYCSDIKLESETSLLLTHNNSQIKLNADRIILCAGEGNEALLDSWTTDIKKPDMQRRPLHMVSVRVTHEAPAYLHCIGDSFGMTPRLTITSHPCRDGNSKQWIWYVGGELAESGVKLDAEQQKKRAGQELSGLFPWVDFSDASWHSFFINRAEPRIADLQRPDNAHVSECGKVLVCWPTKLTLSPNLGDTVRQLLPPDLKPVGPSSSNQQLAALLPKAVLADSPWEQIR
ncbi:MAG: FAD-dependent oxidoreductase [Pseudohongiella sp.]|nr:FAD-dependent oxidoreductase [Pseudohongiella sp.]